MTTPYCSKNQFAERKGYANWAAYVAAGYQHPDPEELDAALEDATDIMNDSEHLNCKSTNITNSDYTQRLERICLSMAIAILQYRGQYEAQGAGMFRRSPQDFLFDFERRILLTASVELGYRDVGGVG